MNAEIEQSWLQPGDKGPVTIDQAIALPSPLILKGEKRPATKRSYRRGGLNPQGSQMILRWAGPPIEEQVPLSDPAQVAKVWKKFVASQDWFDHSKESLVVFGSDARNRFKGWHLVSTGSVNGMECNPREVLRAALSFDAWGIVVVHNHPSGVVTPSRRDEFATRGLAQACRQVGVCLLDHVIVDSAGTDHYSFRSAWGDGFAELGEMDRKPPASPPAQSIVRADQPHSQRGMATGVKVTIRLPRPLVWNHSEATLQGALFSAVQNVHSVEWERRWNAGKSLKRHHKRQKQYKVLLDSEFILDRADWEALEIAATGIRERPETLLAAIAGEVDVSLRTGVKAEAAKIASEPPQSKILQFVR